MNFLVVMSRALVSLDRHSERALLIGCRLPKQTRREAHDSLEELEQLALSAGATIVEKKLCEIRQQNPATLIGKGWVTSVTERISSGEIDLVILDESLSPTQNRNLEDQWGLTVLDRTGIILDIFARRARTREGKIQVEMAQLSYLLPRLVGRGTELSRLAGGIGTRGPGETKLEIDRRRARERLSRLAKDLKQIQSHRLIHRGRREQVPIPIVSLVGYTNAGKSTLMNSLTGAGVLVEDQLFATLDPTVRRLKLPSRREVLLSDTVGFIHKLPHELVQAFRATFEEVAAADLLLHVIDLSHPRWEEQCRTVEAVLKDFDLDGKRVLKVFNKVDRTEAGDPRVQGLFISALKGTGLNHLKESIDRELSQNLMEETYFLPHSAGRLLSLLYSNGHVSSVKHLKRGVRVRAAVEEKFRRQLDLYRDRG